MNELKSEALVKYQAELEMVGPNNDEWKWKLRAFNYYGRMQNQLFETCKEGDRLKLAKAAKKMIDRYPNNDRLSDVIVNCWSDIDAYLCCLVKRVGVNLFEQDINLCELWSGAVKEKERGGNPLPQKVIEPE